MQCLEQVTWLQGFPNQRQEKLKERAQLKHFIKTLEHNFSAPLDELDDETRSQVLEGRLKARSQVPFAASPPRAFKCEMEG